MYMSLSECLPRTQDHDSLAGGLFQLHLDGAELLVDDLHHTLDFLLKPKYCFNILNFLQAFNQTSPPSLGISI